MRSNESHKCIFQLRGNTIDGIHSEFVGTYDKATGRIFGRVRLYNELKSMQQFPMFELFPLHVRLRGENEQYLSRRGGIIDPIVRIVTIESSQFLVKEFDF